MQPRLHTAAPPRYRRYARRLLLGGYMDAIFEQAAQISREKSPDDAARFLAPYRKDCCERLHQEPAAIGDLLRVTTAQMEFLNRADCPDKAVGIAEWFLHVLHHLEAENIEVDFRQLKHALRESFSRFFRRYAQSLRDVERFEDMRLAMRTALDLTREIPMAVVTLVHLYLPLRTRETIEDDTADTWLLKRFAEALATLDFSGYHDASVRTALDHAQYAIRCPDKKEECLREIEALCDQNEDDLELKTLHHLFCAALKD